MSKGAIDRYLRQLEHELRVKRAPRRRLLTEAADHLNASAAAIRASGVDASDAEEEAVARFGAAALVAGRFAHAAATTAVRTGLVWAATAFAGYAVAALAFVLGAPTWLRDFPQGAPSGIGLQVAAVALALTTLRALRARATLTLDEPRLRFVANGVAISALAVAVAAGAELVLAVTRPAAAPWGEARTLIAVYGVAAVAALAAAFVGVAVLARARTVEALPRATGASLSAEAALLVEDVAATAPALRGVAVFATSRPALACTIFAAVAFGVSALVTAWGSDFAQHASIVVGAFTTGLFEAVAVVVAYLTLGRALGLRPRRRVVGA